MDRNAEAGEALQGVFRRMRARRGSASSPRIDPSEVLRTLELAAGDGDSADKYQLGEEIGAGGFGIVYRGTDAHLGRAVALKFLNERFREDPAVVGRFLEEAQIGGQLQHPGIVPVHDVGIRDGQLFFAMRIIHGQALSSLLATHPDADPGRWLKVFDAVCQTLAYAHSRGVVHRDLKPANIMVGEFGEVQVVDWGMAKVLHRDGSDGSSTLSTLRHSPAADQTTTSVAGSVMGTPEYMPPEQARGQHDRLDARADVFALGAILLEILTGRPPYDEGESAARIEAARRCELDGVRRRLEEAALDQALVDLCLRCLQTDPESRPADAGVLAAEVSAYLGALQARADEARLAAARAEVRVSEERRARRLTAGLAVTSVGIVLLAAGFWILDAQRRSETDAAVLGHLQTVEQAREAGDLTRALAAADAARALTDTGEASATLGTRATQIYQRINAELARQREGDRLAALRRSWRRAIEEIRLPDKTVWTAADWRRLSDDYASVFAAAGVQCFGPSLATALTQAGKLGDPLEVAAVLDLWSYYCWRADRSASLERLVALQNHLDPEPRRQRLRKARFHHPPPSLAQRVAVVESLEIHEQLPALQAVAQILSLQARATGREQMRLARVELFRRALRAAPQRYGLIMQLAQALVAAGDQHARSSVRYYSAALALRPDNVEVRHQYARVLQELVEDFPAALEQIQECVRRRPADPHLWWHLSSVQRSLNQSDAAIASARRAIDLARSPELADEQLRARILLAQSLRQAQQDRQATRLLRKLLAEHEDSAISWSILGNALVAQGKPDQAVSAFRRALALEDDPQTHYNFALVLMDQKQHKQAQHHLQEALRLDPDHVEARSDLALTYADLGQRDVAIRTLRRTLEVDPYHGRSWFSLGCELVNLLEVNEAVHCLRRARELQFAGWKPQNLVMALEIQAHQLRRRKKTQAADRARDEARALQITKPQDRYELGMGLLHRGVVSAAVHHLGQAVRTAPDRSIFRYDYGNALGRLKQDEAAVTQFRAATRLDPAHAESWCNLGYHLARLARHEESLQAYLKGHELGSKRKDWRYPSAQWVENARARVAASRRK